MPAANDSGKRNRVEIKRNMEISIGFYFLTKDNQSDDRAFYSGRIPGSKQHGGNTLQRNRIKPYVRNVIKISRNTRVQSVRTIVHCTPILNDDFYFFVLHIKFWGLFGRKNI